MNRRVIWSLLALGLAAGCKRHSPAPEANTVRPDPTAARGAPAPPPDNPTPIVVAEGANVDATLSQLSTELHNYVARTRSVPKDFEDFVAKSHVQPPAPPAGKKYAIKAQAIVLVRR